MLVIVEYLNVVQNNARMYAEEMEVVFVDQLDESWSGEKGGG